MTFKKALLVTLIAAPLFGVSAFAQQKQINTNVAAALNSLQPGEIRSDIAYLADDKLAGRSPGTPGYQIAVDYIIHRLKSLQVSPAGENGTPGLQTVRFRNARVSNSSFLG